MHGIEGRQRPFAGNRATAVVKVGYQGPESTLTETRFYQLRFAKKSLPGLEA